MKSLDGVPQGIFSGNSGSNWNSSNSVLFFASNLKDASHSIAVTNIAENDSGGFFGFSDLKVWRTAVANSTSAHK